MSVEATMPAPVPAGRARDRRPVIVLAVLGLATLAAATVFMTIDVRASWSFVLPFRGAKLATMALVGYAIATSTVLFQTVTNNRILTPSIMGFDALYVLLQTALVFFTGTVIVAFDPKLRFLAEVAVMAGFALILYRWLFSGAVRSLYLLVLVGIVFGVLFRSLSNFMQRLIDPNAFAVLQDRFFASFNTIDDTLLGIAAFVVLAVTLAGVRLLPALDVLTLGRETAIGLGVAYRRVVMQVLFLVTVLVSVSTALVGPVAFFGLLVANLAYLVVGSHRHVFVLPAAALLAITCLVGGQVIVERLFAFDTSLAIIVEFVGGLFFIALVLKRGVR